MDPPPTSDRRATHPPAGGSLALHTGLFLLTCLSTTWAGAQYVNPAQAETSLADLLRGLPFSVSLMGILLTHEMGHFVAAKVHHVRVSLPYFLPLPFGFVGTLGAVIAMKDRIARRDALVDVGAAGPIAGLIVAIPVLAYGIHLSPVAPTGPGVLEGNSLLYLGLKYAIKGQILPGNGLDLQMHSVAWAGWVGLFVTMVNLLPIGQLDGGHIAFAYFGSSHNGVSRWLHRALLPLGLGVMAYVTLDLTRQLDVIAALPLGAGAGLTWIVWWLLLHVMRRRTGGRYHPPVDDHPPSQGRRRLCVGLLLVFVAIFMPIPLRVTLG